MKNRSFQRGFDFVGGKTLGDLITENQFDEAVSKVAEAVELEESLHAKEHHSSSSHVAPHGKIFMPWYFGSEGSGIFSNRLFTQSFKDPSMERLYALNVSLNMRKRFMVANSAVFLLMIMTWTALAPMIYTHNVLGNQKSRIITALGCTYTATGVLLAVPLLALHRRLNHLTEYMCYISYTLISALWVMWNYMLKSIPYQETSNPYQVLTTDTLVWCSSLVFGLGILVIMDLFLSLRSCWTSFLHLVHLGIYVTGGVMTLPGQHTNDAWAWGMFTMVPYCLLAVICFWEGCIREFELRSNFVYWATKQANSPKNVDSGRSIDHFLPSSENLYERVRSCGELLEHMQGMDESKTPTLQQYISQLNNTIQTCLSNMQTERDLYEMSYNELEVKEEQQEVMDAYVWGSFNRSCTKAFTTKVQGDTNLETQIYDVFSTSFTQLSAYEIDDIEPLDLGDVFDWDFDVLEYFNNNSDTPFISLGYRLLQRYMEAYDVKKETVVNFLSVVEALYRNVPYHNMIHGALVAQKILCLAKYVGLYDTMSIVEEAMMVVAAISHDIGHPGRNNAFLVRTRHPIAQIYNDHSVLENFHAACTLKILRIAECSIFTESDYDNMRSQIVELILATDTVDHFQMVSQFNVKCTNSDFSFDDPKNKLLTCKLLIKAADVAAPLMNWECSLEWVQRLMAELYSQGDEESSLGIPISALCDRNHNDQLAKSQAAFLTLVVTPLYQSVSLIQRSGEMDRILQRLEENTDRWKQMHEDGNIVDLYEFVKFTTDLDMSWIVNAMDKYVA
ncbi:cyclic nucleotide phosphodiesterase [Babesia gibsoni]|uniref:Phosphodiesterase n=1 Tax=Babesia gibsoni TaxID=33632 RepID=A0AAD8LQT0_BABGI|nr:cyclic nucleotide phosphodiesterase [Babesia gibsoni]